jgi:hypothetical protein
LILGALLAGDICAGERASGANDRPNQRVLMCRNRSSMERFLFSMARVHAMVDGLCT